MKLDYATLISPCPLYLPKIGNIKSPTLKEIWSPHISYQGYSVFLSLLLIDLQNYCDKINPQKAEWFNSLSDEEKQHLNIFDIISSDKELQEQYKRLLEFFFVENIEWDDYNSVYFTYIERDETGQVIPVGMIHKEIWNELCDVILQRCGVSRSDTDKVDKSKIKNKRALAIWNKLKKGKQNTQKNQKIDKDVELPNIIAKISVMAKSINFINIWDLTVFQLYEHFRQECINVSFDISKISVGAYGNEKKTFKGNEWYKNEN